MLAKALILDDARNGKTAFKAILIRGLHRADKENAGYCVDVCDCWRVYRVRLFLCVGGIVLHVLGIACYL